MVERVTALAEVEWAQHRHADLVLRELAVAGSWLVWSVSPAANDAIRAPLERIGMGMLPAEPGAAQRTTGTLVATIGSGRWLLITTDEADAEVLQGALAPGMAIECRCQRAWLRLEGRSAARFLDRRLALDLQGGDLPPGRAAATRLGQVDVLVHARPEGGYDLLPARSFAAALAETLQDAAVAEGDRLAIVPVGQGIGV